MFEIVNTPRDYAWGDFSAIAALQNRSESGLPEAEVWFGDHPASPSRRADTGETLADWANAHPERAATRGLPFLVKILAAASPLSIQVHPDRDRARQGFARENDAGINVDASVRNYRDDNHKPEIIVALSDFDALCGLRPTAERSAIVDELVSLGVTGAERLRERLSVGVGNALAWILGDDPIVRDLVAGLAAVSATNAAASDALAVARNLSTQFPGDRGIAVSLLLNHVALRPGEALYLPTGNIHAYLRGLGVEVMARSDNVLRGGLTGKHIDVDEFLAVADLTELPSPRLEPRVDGTRRVFDPGLEDFVVTELTGAGTLGSPILGPAIAVVVDGTLILEGDCRLELSSGRAAFIERGETLTGVTGSGRVIIAHLPGGNPPTT